MITPLHYRYADSLDTHLHSLVLSHLPTNFQNIDRKKAGNLKLKTH